MLSVDGIKGSMYKVMKSFICRSCVNPVSGTGRTSVPGQEVDQKKTLREIVQKDCQARKLNREDAMDRNRWMKQIWDD